MEEPSSSSSPSSSALRLHDHTRPPPHVIFDPHHLHRSEHVVDTRETNPWLPSSRWFTTSSHHHHHETPSPIPCIADHRHYFIFTIAVRRDRGHQQHNSPPAQPVVLPAPFITEKDHLHLFCVADRRGEGCSLPTPTRQGEQQLPPHPPSAIPQLRRHRSPTTATTGHFLSPRRSPRQ
ncbi:hypothetical protein Dimus_014055, partial [Dionaea muscipula]